MKKYSFPSIESRQNVHDTIINFTLGKLNRIDMMRIVGNIIEKYGVTKIPVFGYNVKILQYHKIKFNGGYLEIPIISIEGAQFSEVCPVCQKETETRYLRTEEENFDKDYDIVAINCLDCGCLYATKGDNHRRYRTEVR